MKNEKLLVYKFSFQICFKIKANHQNRHKLIYYEQQSDLPWVRSPAHQKTSSSEIVALV